MNHLTNALKSAERVISPSSNLGTGTTPLLNGRLGLKLALSSISGDKLIRGLFYTPRLYSTVSPPLADTPTSTRPPSPTRTPSTQDINSILGSQDLSFITRNIHRLIDSEHPLLSTVSSYYFNTEGKKLRPLLVLLSSKMYSSSLSVSAAGTPPCADATTISPDQFTLAFITEIIHTASLLHDDVIDDATSRRNLPSANLKFGNKLSILAGDYLLSRASVALARLRNCNVVELLAECIGDLVQGEVLQFNPHLYQSEDSWRRGVRAVSAAENFVLSPECEASFETYIRKSYMKTASLIAKSCQASILLRNSDDAEAALNAYEFGKNLGISFQLIDDLLDYTASSEQLGKPSNGSDLRLGLATAPLIFASIRDPSLKQFMTASFSSKSLSSEQKDQVLNDALMAIRNSQGLELTKKLAVWYQQQALLSLHKFQPCPARTALETISLSVIERTK